MNKNLFACLLLSAFSLTFANETTDIVDETVVATTEVVEIVEPVQTATEEVTTTEPENVVAAVESVVEAADEAVIAPFAPQVFSITYTIAPASNDDQDFIEISKELQELIDSGNRGASNFSQKLLTFIKELQEAIFAGLNLVTAASTSNESTSELAQETVVTIAEEVVQEVIDANTPSTKGISDKLELTFSIIADKVESLAIWETLKEKMTALAQAINLKTKSALEINDMFVELLEEAQAQDIHGSLSLSRTCNTCDK